MLANRNNNKSSNNNKQSLPQQPLQLCEVCVYCTFPFSFAIKTVLQLLGTRTSARCCSLGTASWPGWLAWHGMAWFSSDAFHVVHFWRKHYDAFGSVIFIVFFCSLFSLSASPSPSLSFSWPGRWPVELRCLLGSRLDFWAQFCCFNIANISPSSMPSSKLLWPFCCLFGFIKNTSSHSTPPHSQHHIYSSSLYVCCGLRSVLMLHGGIHFVVIYYVLDSFSKQFLLLSFLYTLPTHTPTHPHIPTPTHTHIPTCQLMAWRAVLHCSNGSGYCMPEGRWAKHVFNI